MKTIHHVLDIDAGTDSVWSALTEPDRMAGWWSTKLRTPPAAPGARVDWTFAGDFNPVMEITTLDDRRELGWRCVDGHDPWKDNTFRFELGALDDNRTRLRFWQDYAVELSDDAYGIYSFNWAYYLESLRLLCGTGTGKPFRAAVTEGEAAPMNQTRLKQSTDYTRRREELRLAEIDLMHHREQVASVRRSLPEDTRVDDYRFDEGPPRLEDGDAPVRSVRLSELFSTPDRPLLIYHLMYGKAQTSPCPMCTLWLDGLNGVAHHIGQNVDFAVAAAADLPELRAHARARGWDQLRLLSCADNTFKFDLLSEDADGNQDSTVSVFTLGADGSPRHFYSAHPTMSADIDQRGLDLLAPVWHVLDLTPQGRDDWYAQLDYGR